MPGRKQSWSEMSPRQRALVAAGGALQLGLLLAALNDLRRRPADQVNGGKARWVAISFVNFVGPIAYFAFGRKR